MKLLIAVITCQKYRSRADIQRETWLHDALAHGIDVRFFVGGGATVEKDYEVALDVPDDYMHVREKVQLAMQWSVDHDYDHTLKTDDDCVVFPRVWSGTGFYNIDYVGRQRGPSGAYFDPDPKGLTHGLKTGHEIYGSSERSFCSGFGYTVSNTAARIIANAPDNGDWAEDRFAGNALAAKGIPATNSRAYVLWPLLGHCVNDPAYACPHCTIIRTQAAVVCPYNQQDKVEFIWRERIKTGMIPTGKP